MYFEFTHGKVLKSKLTIQINNYVVKQNVQNCHIAFYALEHEINHTISHLKSTLQHVTNKHKVLLGFFLIKVSS
jgi:hypothetical protein